jgi:2,4'-dihydroxyacetophenone dioxygenase
MLPRTVYEQKELLTIHRDQLPIYKDAMPGLPGIDVQPLSSIRARASGCCG